MNKIKN